MFKITEGKGFQVTFKNGWTVSVQFGAFNYCSNRDNEIGDIEACKKGSKTAEIAAWDSKGTWYDFGDDVVKGYVTPEEVLDFMNKIATKEEE
jgi:hypothetical protein